MTGDNMNKPIIRPVAPEEDVEDAVANALESLKVEQPGEPMAYAEEEQAPHRDLIIKSKASFENHLKQLQSRIDAVNRNITSSIHSRDEAIRRAEDHHKERLRELERDLYLIKTLRGAIELAIVALGDDE
jgi:hypothetical protein